MGDSSVIIAISGPSCSGKSTITNMLASKHSMHSLCLDDYWNLESDRKFLIETNKQTHRLYELAAEYDGEKLAVHAQLYTDAIIEGFCIMAFSQIRKIADIHFHIDVPWNVLRKRRSDRDCDNNASKGWMALGERGNELLTGFQRDLANTVILDGTQPVEENVDLISDYMLDLSIK